MTIWALLIALLIALVYIIPIGMWPWLFRRRWYSMGCRDDSSGDKSSSGAKVSVGGYTVVQ